MVTPEQYRQKTTELSGLIEEQAGLLARLDPSQPMAAADLSMLGRKLTDEDFRVLLMGRFSSGKSTFLNALMGRMLLPAKPLPTTAMIGEISYADEPVVELVHKDTSKENLRIPPEQLGQYIVIDHTNRSDSDSPENNIYSKVFIRYPLEVCRNGVTFVDSPGLDDPTCHDEITTEYLPKADAIIYCMNAQNAYSAKDKMEIERLRNLGYTSIIFVLTYFDLLENNDRLMGTNQAQETKEHYTRMLEGLTDMGRQGIFFVGSLPALMGKVSGNRALLESSYITEVESRLERLLFQEKGRMKLARVIAAGRNANRDVNRRVSDLIDIAAADRTSLAARVQKATQILDNARAKATNIEKQFDTGINAVRNDTKDRVRMFIATRILPEINGYLDDFTPTEDATISIFHPKRTARKYTEECIAHIQSKIENDFAVWTRDDLVANFLVPRMTSLLEQQQANIDSLQSDLEKVRSEMKVSLNPDEVGDQNDNLYSRVAAAIVGCFVGGGLYGATLGWAALGGAIVGQLVGLIVGYIVLLFSPAAWPAALVLTIIGGFIGGDVAGCMSMQKRINKKVIAQTKDNIVQQQESIVNGIGAKLGEALHDICGAVNDTLMAPVRESQAMLDEAARVAGAQTAELEERVGRYRAIRNENSALAEKFDEFARDL